MKKVILGALVGIATTLVIFGIGAATQQAPNFSYVYSASMEPVIHVGDGFIVIPKGNLELNDVIVFRPLKLEAAFVTHRIVELTANGFITKGDNNPNTDQLAGEPPVTVDRVLGKALMISGNIITIPYYGKLVEAVQTGMGKYNQAISLLLIAFGAMLFLKDVFFPKKKRKSRRYLRLRDLYQILAILVSGSVIIFVLFGSSMRTVDYLISESPGDIGLQVKVNESGQVPFPIKNNSLVPVYHFSEAVYPLKIADAPSYIGPLSEEKITIAVEPQSSVGWYKGYIQTYNIPALLPRSILSFLFTISPLAAIAVFALATYGWLLVLIKIFEWLFDLQGWIPLHALKDKLTSRRIQYTLNKYLGKRRVKS